MRKTASGPFACLSRQVLCVLACAALLGLESAAEAQTVDSDDEDPDEVAVPADWALKPAGVGAGGSFRLLFVTTTTRDGTSDQIGDYNTHVQAAAATGHTAIRSYSAQFRAVASTDPTDGVDARDNTATTGTGVPIYWLDGAKVADDYADFYDGTWDSGADAALDEEGMAASGVALAWTGSDVDGTAHATAYLGVASGHIQAGPPNIAAKALSVSAVNRNTRLPLYGLSPVFRVASPPTVSEVRFASTPPAGQNNTYKLDDTITVEVVFSETVTVTGTPAVELLIGAATRDAGYTGGSGTDTLTFAYQVANTDEDTDGAGIAKDGLKLDGGTIKNAAGTADANLAHAAVADDDTRKVDGVAPTVSTVEITSTPGAEGFYEDGDAIRIAVAFSEAVEVGGSPAIGLTVGKTEREAGFEEVPAATPATAAFEYAVGAVDFDPDGVGIPANGLSGGTVHDLAGNEAVLDHEAVAGSAAQKVAGSVGTPNVSIEGVIGREDMDSASFTVSLAFPSDFDVKVDYATSDGTATAGSDYTTTSGTLTIPAGSPRATIAVPILPDTDDEADETFSVTLTRPTGALLTIATAEATATIKDDDGDTEAYFGRTAYSVTEGESRTITVNLIPAATRFTRIRVRTANRGTSSADYSVTPSVVTFRTGESSMEVTFTATSDQAGDDGEQVLLQLSPGIGGASAGDDATVTIRDPTGPEVSIRALRERVEEGSDVVFELTRDGDSAAALGVGLELEFHDKIVRAGDRVVAGGGLRPRRGLGPVLAAEHRRRDERGQRPAGRDHRRARRRRLPDQRRGAFG